MGKAVGCLLTKPEWRTLSDTVLILRTVMYRRLFSSFSFAQFQKSASAHYIEQQGMCGHVLPAAAYYNYSVHYTVSMRANYKSTVSMRESAGHVSKEYRCTLFNAG